METVPGAGSYTSSSRLGQSHALAMKTSIFPSSLVLPIKLPNINIHYQMFPYKHISPPHSPPSTPCSPWSSYSAAENGSFSMLSPTSTGTPSPSPTRSHFDMSSMDRPPRPSRLLLRRLRIARATSRGIDLQRLTPQRIGRAIGAKFMRGVKRGSLPFLIVFFSCIVVFFSALTGVGYTGPISMDPLDAVAAPSTDGGFILGEPGFDLTNDRLRLERKMAEQKALEEAWVRMSRPMDGAWMRQQRDHKAVRRVPVQQGNDVAYKTEVTMEPKGGASDKLR
ncbi:uncharacterized protein L203_104887 [Cryptococcus depauperatus CBS 7841]|uniref:Uncharacterized protein n=1 Tax=Cryptococcus depauperatus CBS 7841 TaxID=1295531 RepID=A0AAJ8M3F3_9TREE